jgi:hypothetical protein
MSKCNECGQDAERPVHGLCRACFNKAADAFEWANAYYALENRTNKDRAELFALKQSKASA